MAGAPAQKTLTPGLPRDLRVVGRGWVETGELVRRTLMIDLMRLYDAPA